MERCSQQCEDILQINTAITIATEASGLTALKQQRREEAKKMALKRAMSMPLNLRLVSGNRIFSGTELFTEIMEETEVGKRMIEMEDNFRKFCKENKFDYP